MNFDILLKNDETAINEMLRALHFRKVYGKMPEIS